MAWLAEVSTKVYVLRRFIATEIEWTLQQPHKRFPRVQLWLRLGHMQSWDQLFAKQGQTFHMCLLCVKENVVWQQLLELWVIFGGKASPWTGNVSLLHLEARRMKVKPISVLDSQNRKFCKPVPDREIGNGSCQATATFGTGRYFSLWSQRTNLTISVLFL